MRILPVLFAALSVICAAGEPEAHVAEVVARVKSEAARLKAADPGAVPMAFWDFDGTIMEGDVTEGLERDGQHVFSGMVAETIAAGLNRVYKGADGYARYKADYARMNEIGRWLAWPYNAQMFDGVRVAELDALCAERFDTVFSRHYFASSVAIMQALEAAGIENYVVSASPESFVANAAKTLGLPRERLRAIRVEVAGGRLTTRLVHPVPYGEGKVENVRELVAARPHGVAVAGFGNSYSTDGAFLRYIVLQRLPGGAKGFAMMINGGKEKPGFEGLFMCVEQRSVTGPQ